MRLIEVIPWYFRRFRVMTSREILYRVEEQWFLLWLRLKDRLGHHSESNSRNYSFCSATAHQLPALPWAFEPSVQDRQDLLDGKTAALGFDWTWNENPDIWHRAPDTGTSWPLKFFSRIPCRAGNPYGDARVVWEPSRLQQLVSLALLARDSETDRQQAVDLLRRQLVSWVAANPPYRGIHYTSSMECALRIIASCHALDLVRPFLNHDDRVWGALASLLSSHAALIYRRLSLYSSAGNHTVAECAGLVYAGILFPELGGAKHWKRKGLHVLAHEARRQILDDGGGIERSLWYHTFVTDLSGLVMSLLEKTGEQNTGEIRQAVTRARKFLNTFSNTPEGLPAIGDSDNGYALSRYLRLTWVKKVGMNHLDTFGETGISVLRDKEGDVRLFFDHGPIGMAPCYGHGHADGLSVSLRDRDGKLLDSAGTFTYTGDTGWREYFRGTSAHNTVCIDGSDQAVQQSAFMWTSPYEARLVSSQVEESETFLLACHDGYLADKGVVHWRGIIHTAGSGFVIWDYLDGNGRHSLALNWHAPRLEVKAQGKLSLSDSMHIEIDGGEINLVAGGKNSRLGWMSDLYGVKYPCQTINTTYAGNLPHEFTTRIIPDGRRFDSNTVARGIARFKEIINDAKTN